MKKIAKKISILLILSLLLGGVSYVNSSVGQAKAKPKISNKKVTMEINEDKEIKVKNATKKVKWKTSNKKVVEIFDTYGKKNSKCILVSNGVGTATITAKVGKKQLKCKVTVKTKVLQFSADKKALNLNIGDKGQILLTIKTIGTYKVSVSFDNESVVGLWNLKKINSETIRIDVIAKGVGTAKITIFNDADNSKQYVTVNVGLTAAQQKSYYNKLVNVLKGKSDYKIEDSFRWGREMVPGGLKYGSGGYSIQYSQEDNTVTFEYYQNSTDPYLKYSRDYSTSINITVDLDKPDIAKVGRSSFYYDYLFGLKRDGESATVNTSTLNSSYSNVGSSYVKEALEKWNDLLANNKLNMTVSYLGFGVKVTK